MKSYLSTRRSISFLAVLFAAGLFLTANAQVQIPINDGWRFKQARLTNWYPATVPGVVHTDLLDNEIIEDPFFRLNERGLQWVDKEDWIYETVIDISADVMAHQNVELVFEGLDTYADVFLNDSLVLKADNMFRRWTVDAKPLLHQGKNTVRVYFNSPVKVDMPKWEALPFHYEASNDQSENGGLLDRRISVFARKAGYHYGWDWGPRLVTCGIWRPVYLRAWDDARIDDIFFRQPQVNAKLAQIVTNVTVDASQALQNVVVTVRDRESGLVVASKKTDIQKGVNNIQLPFTIKNPKLWWSNGLGEPHLYNFTTTVAVGDKVIDSNLTRVGVRSIKLIRKPDQWGHTFYFELNGRPVFAKGANYIPNDNFLTRVSAEKYHRVVADARDANMNMLRVWGGGIYENNIFYDLCDEMGIMVWQDFMFGCSVYPAEGALLENIRLEAIDNVKRLRNHACIALWCGNNECNDAWFGWGWKEKYEKMNPEYAKTIYRQYLQQYEVTLPAVVKEYDPDKFYWPSSPFAFSGSKSQGKDGDMHYWEVWHGKVPVETYNKVSARFFSEYGFQSFPEFITVMQYAPNPKDWDIRSEVMMSHQRGGEHANELIETYLLNEYKRPRDFRSFLYMNAVLQGDAIKTAIEAHRRQMPYNMGSLFWQHNDCWPVASWSSRDYYGRWKAMHYYARKAYADILISPIVEDGQLNIYAVSDRLKKADGKLTIETVRLDGNVTANTIKRVSILSNTSTKIYSSSLNDILAGNKLGDVYVRVRFTDREGASYTNNYFLCKQKDVAYQRISFDKKLEFIDGGVRLTLKADKFARAVFISLPDINSTLTDNYFDMQAGEELTVTINTGLQPSEINTKLEVTCLNNEF